MLEALLNLLDPEVLQTAQGFCFGISQNTLSSAIQQAKIEKDSRDAATIAALAAEQERAKTLEQRIAQQLIAAIRNPCHRPGARVYYLHCAKTSIR
jgi:hypothetical protein